MSSTDKLQEVVKILKLLEFNHIQLIAELNWRDIPQSYKLVNSWIIENKRVTLHNLANNTIMKIEGIGLFQTM